MRAFRTIEYKSFLIGKISFDQMGRISSRRTEIRTREINSGMAVINVGDRCWDARDQLLFREGRNVSSADAAIGEKLYISPDCKTSRDLFRNSGYKLVRDKDKADRIVVPAFRDEYPRYTYEFILFDPGTGQLTLFSVFRNEGVRKALDHYSEDDVQRTKEYLKFCYGDNCEFIVDSFQENDCYIIPHYKDHIAMLNETGLSQKYIRETRVWLNCSTTISPETLRIWKASKDEEVVARAICTSNWQDYPITLCAFLYDKSSITGHGGNNFRLVLQQIGYKPGYGLYDMIRDREVSPDDWNMLQRYMMMLMGLPEEGGVLRKGMLSKLPYKYKDLFLRQMTVVKPLYIKQPVALSVATNICNEC